MTPVTLLKERRLAHPLPVKGSILEGSEITLIQVPERAVMSLSKVSCNG